MSKEPAAAQFTKFTDAHAAESSVTFVNMVDFTAIGGVGKNKGSAPNNLVNHLQARFSPRG